MPAPVAVVETLQPFAFTLLGGTLAFVGAQLPIVRHLFAVVGDGVTLVGDPIAFVGHPFAAQQFPLSASEVTLAVVEFRRVRIVPGPAVGPFVTDHGPTLTPARPKPSYDQKQERQPRCADSLSRAEVMWSKG